MEHPNFLVIWRLSNLRPLSSKQNLLDGSNRTRHKKNFSAIKDYDIIFDLDNEVKDDLSE